MVSKTGKAMLVAAIATAMTTLAVAQTAPQTSQGSPIGSAAASFGADPARYRTLLMASYGINNPALRLSAAQQAEIGKIIDAHVPRHMALNQQYPMPKNGERPSQAEMQAKQAATAEITAALGRVMNSEQRKIWEAEQTARRPVPLGGSSQPLRRSTQPAR